MGSVGRLWRPVAVASVVLTAAIAAPMTSVTAFNVYPGPTPKANCGPGSNPETSRQGRMSAADASGPGKNGFWCNMQLISHFGTRGGYKVERFVDKAGHECAFYDSTLLFPKDAVAAGQDLTGVYVLDMTDPAHPVHSATLSTPAMQSPHESMSLNKKRGLLAAVTGNPAFYPGFIDVYDVNADCRHPALQSSIPSGLLGHESGFAPDGNTFYAASLDGGTVTAVDVSNPQISVPLWLGQYKSHGLSISNDGTRAYLATRPTSNPQPGTNGMVVLDVSQVQARVTNPQVTVVSHLTWPEESTPQITIPVTIKGHPYIVEMDEFGSGATIGAGRIIDMADEKNPFVISNIRLEVNMPQYQGGDAKNPANQANDPGALTTFRGYEGHYCEVPQRADPGVVACTFILSGLRLFDIRDPYHPKEIAYFNGPPTAGTPSDSLPDATSGTPAISNFAMSKPTFVPERGEIWYTDGQSGFYALRVTNGAWPFGGAAGSNAAQAMPVALANTGMLADRRVLLTWVGLALAAVALVTVAMVLVVAGPRTRD